MKKLVPKVLAAFMIAATLVGCGPEVAVIATAAAQLAPIVGAIGGTVWLLTCIESVTLDNQKKRLEIQAIKDGVRGVYPVDLTDDQYRQVLQTGRVRLGDQEFDVN